MQLEILGSGGATLTPRPGCSCRTCQQARSRGVPYSRSGPCLFVHGPELLFDTPEEISIQLNRSGVRQINGCFYSHWHPDHTMGRRVWEMNYDYQNWPAQNRCTDIYLPQQVAHDFRTRLGLYEHFTYMARHGVVQLHELSDGESVTVGSTRVTPFRLAENYVYAFLLEDQGKRLLVAMDELFGWQPPAHLRGVDMAFLPMGIADTHPLSGERLMHAEHPVLTHEATFTQTLEMIRKLEPKQVILSHIEEPFGLDPDTLNTVAARLQHDGLPVSFAYDTLLVDV
jgi:phosphoribosyl 1,2-cyclic phosphate phosphodiesterase